MDVWEDLSASVQLVGIPLVRFWDIFRWSIGRCAVGFVSQGEAIGTCAHDEGVFRFGSMTAMCCFFAAA